MATHLLYSTKPSAVHLNTMRKRSEYKRQRLYIKDGSRLLYAPAPEHISKNEESTRLQAAVFLWIKS